MSNFHELYGNSEEFFINQHLFSDKQFCKLIKKQKKQTKKTKTKANKKTTYFYATLNLSLNLNLEIELRPFVK